MKVRLYIAGEPSGHYIEHECDEAAPLNGNYISSFSESRKVLYYNPSAVIAVLLEGGQPAEQVSMYGDAAALSI